MEELSHNFIGICYPRPPLWVWEGIVVVVYLYFMYISSDNDDDFEDDIYGGVI